ncbi:unnamed protein product [Ranitomeya imitator]|uniref:non-specific serine/threonine protein kinase n=1 Tax=Ranitomeya imitator TaxID=111125 RepID=A0ABN9MAM7_9NEOB|nr:unnamed protein product [Ranitomeya imitator]
MPKKGNAPQPAGRSITDLLQSGNIPKMAAAAAQSPATATQAEGDTDQGGSATNMETVISTAALTKSLQETFRAELSAAMQGIASQLQDIMQRTNNLEEKMEIITDALEEDHETIKNHIDRINELELRCEDYENRSRRSNLRIRGLPEHIVALKETATALFTALLPDTDPSLLHITRIHRALEALFGRAPFASRSFSELEEKIRSNQSIELPTTRVSPECRDLLQRLLVRDPDQRIPFPDFFSHPFVDLEHMPCVESLQKAAAFVVEAVEKDGAGEHSSALTLYCRALEYFIPALHYETDVRHKEAIRSKVCQYVSRAEELKVLVSSNNKSLLQQGISSRELLKEMSQDKPRLFAALDVASAGILKDEEGMAADALDLYQQSLGELILMLSGKGNVLGYVNKTHSVLNTTVLTPYIL